MNKYAIRTDLATEAISEQNETCETKVMIQGIEVRKLVINEFAGEQLKRKPGLYYTLDTRAIKTHDNDDIVKCENVLANVIKEVMLFSGIKETDKGLIVGLGNISVTPDSLGPLVIDNVIVTRHMFLIDPSMVSPGIRDVSAIAPGVMGTTGIETFDIIEAVVKKIKVDYVIAVDALASRALDRVNKTIQVTNTGISPGSGVGNKRKELSYDTIGIPVIAIGVPTVVDAVTIANDTIDIILKHLNKINNENNKENQELNDEFKKEIFGSVGVLNDEEKRGLIDEILTPNGFNMMVTPKEVDLDISDLTQIISKAIDQAIHPLVGPYEA